jgi:hypothetical protein
MESNDGVNVERLGPTEEPVNVPQPRMSDVTTVSCLTGFPPYPSSHSTYEVVET